MSQPADRSIFIIRLNWVDVLTLMGILLSSLSIALALSGRFSLALAVVYLAVLVDAFDGILARKFGLERDFGRYLDGFVDVYDYLLTPALFLYLWGFQGWLASPLLILFMMSGVVRLSVFNQVGNIKDENQGLAYLGMPVFWSVLFLGVFYLAHWLVGLAVLWPIVGLVLAVFTVLMVYNGPFYKFKSPLVILVYLVGCAVLFTLDGVGVLTFSEVPEAARLERTLSWIHSPHVITALLLIIPAISGGVLHMIAVKFDWLKILKRPIHERLFGKNKTWRGIVLMPLFSLPGAFLVAPWAGSLSPTIPVASYPPLLFGTMIGLTYILAELPNSFLKRRLGIPPGEKSTRFSFFFVLLDQLDSALGGCLLAACLGAPWPTVLAILVLTPFIAFGIKLLLYLFKLKKEVR